MSRLPIVCCYKGTLAQKLSRRSVDFGGPRAVVKVVGRDLVVFNCNTRAAAVRAVRVHQLSLSTALRLGTVYARLFSARATDGIIPVVCTLFAGEMTQYASFLVYRFTARHVTVSVTDDGLLFIRNARTKREAVWVRDELAMRIRFAGYNPPLAAHDR